jgi:hypothetical protein
MQRKGQQMRSCGRGPELAGSTAARPCLPQLPQQSAKRVSPAGAAAGAQQAVRHRRAPAGGGWDSCGAAGAQRLETQQTAHKQGITRHEVKMGERAAGLRLRGGRR